jgi:hypothetical protein
MLKRLVGTLVLASALALTISAGASAHVLRQDGTITGVLHIAPYDHPVSNTPVTYMFEQLSDSNPSSPFSRQGCDCIITISQDGTTLNTTALASKNTFTFPRAGIYTLQLDGKPSQSAQFADFSLSYTIRVSQGTPPRATAISPVVWIGGGAAILAIIATAYFMQRSETTNHRGSS